ncbi:MAG: redoxin domain-containing protein [Clostridia bacterium]|nr:redoxin domain-containing protein [Clostridia bacterium]
MNAYDFKVKKQDESEISLSEYKGKVLLIVNTATGCGFTPQYEELQALYEEFSAGENAIALYKWLTDNTKFEGFGKSPMALMLSGVVKKTDKDYKSNGNVKWKCFYYGQR